MLGTETAPLGGAGAYHQRDIDVPPEHVPDLGHVVQQLIGGLKGEVGEHQLHNRSHPHDGGT